jgi:MYXO-CTERM domain-containing protein
MLLHRSLMVLIASLLLTASTTPAFAGLYLFAQSNSDNPGFNASVLSFLPPGSTITYLDTNVTTPTVAQLSAYDAVFTWTNSPYSNSTLFGNNLAAYVDGGGRVVLGAFTTYTAGNHLSGGIMAPGYSPVTSPSGNNFFSNSSYAGDGTLLWDGVLGYTAYYRDDVVLQGNGVLDGKFMDGAIAAAYRPDFGVIYLGGMETITATSGDSARLLANALSFNASAEVPEPASMMLWAMAGAAGFAAWRRRSA